MTTTTQNAAAGNAAAGNAAAGNAAAGNAARSAAFRRARRHSALVATLKRALPVAALAITGSFAYAAVTSDAFDAAPVTSADLSQGRIVMQAPELNGYDKRNRPFQLEAAEAVQETGKPTVVALADIDARIPTSAKAFADVDAGRGVYDTERETLRLRDDIRVKGMQGMDMKLEEARFDMRAGTMKSDEPVSVRSDKSAIKADSVRVFESGKRILFKQRVRMVIHNSKADLVGSGPTSKRPWIHTNKLAIEKFAPANLDKKQLKGSE